ncbi:MAG: glycosyltransferase [Sediminibacterium sp.]|nr:glycosyltransferase [Sediminibacterium sp.]
MLLSIIIVNYNSGALLLDCLQSAELDLFDLDKVEWIIVDNSNNTGDKNLITTAFPMVQWVDMGYNAGFARANNQGIELSKGQLVLLLNPDTLLKPGVLLATAHELIQSNLIAAGVQLVHLDGQPQFSASNFMMGGLNHLLPLPYWGAFIKSAASLFIKEKPALIQAANYTEVDWISGAFLMVKKEAIQKAGMLDPEFFLYAEEVEWCARLGKFGKMAVFGNYSIVHLIGQSIQEASNAEDNSYTNLTDKKGLQLMVSNHLRIRKQYGVLWFLFQLLNYTWTVPVYLILGIVDTIWKRKSLVQMIQSWGGFTKNIVELWLVTPIIIARKPHFYKYL